jgi:hypothetical protein
MGGVRLLPQRSPLPAESPGVRPQAAGALCVSRLYPFLEIPELTAILGYAARAPG